MKNVNKTRGSVIAALLFALIIPILNILVLGSLAVITQSDVSYPALIGELLAYVSELIGIICIFAHSAVIAKVQLENDGVLKESRRSASVVSAICLLSPICLYIASIAIDTAFRGSGTFGAVELIPLVINCAFEILRCAIVIRVCRSVRIGGIKRGREYSLELFSLKGTMSRAVVFSTLAIFLSMILTSLTEMVTLLVNIGAPMNASELLYLVKPYPTAIIYSLLGYLAMYLVAANLMKRNGN